MGIIFQTPENDAHWKMANPDPAFCGVSCGGLLWGIQLGGGHCLKKHKINTIPNYERVGK
jgi:hypothetical protein